MVRPFTLPAMWARPLSQTMSWTYSQPYSARTGCTLAQPSSVFQNHSVVAGPAAADQDAICGRYHCGRACEPTVSPWNPRTPYAPSLMIVAGAGQFG